MLTLVPRQLLVTSVKFTAHFISDWCQTEKNASGDNAQTTRPRFRWSELTASSACVQVYRNRSWSPPATPTSRWSSGARFSKAAVLSAPPSNRPPRRTGLCVCRRLLRESELGRWAQVDCDARMAFVSGALPGWLIQILKSTISSKPPATRRVCLATVSGKRQLFYIAPVFRLACC